MKRRAFFALLAAAALAALVLFFVLRAGDRQAPAPAGPPEAGTGIRRWVADLQPLGGGRAAGTLSFAVVGDGAGVAARYRLRNLPPGRHALRVHQLGDCSATDGSSAGAVAAEVGDFFADSWGSARGELRNPRLALGELLGKSVVIEVGTGAGESSGRPIACGVIRPR